MAESIGKISFVQKSADTNMEKKENQIQPFIVYVSAAKTSRQTHIK